jgi:hypothetical protein
LPSHDAPAAAEAQGRDALATKEQGQDALATKADLNRDGRIDSADLALFGQQWGQVNCPVVIHEVLAHAHAAASDWIELHNLSTAPVDIGGWFLSDNKDDLMRYQIPAGTTIGPHGYVVFYETIHFANPLDPGVWKAFAFTENGEAAYLYSDNDEVYPNYLAEQAFGASETGYTFGRHRTSAGTYDFVTMEKPTPAAANAYPRVGPVVIDEIMYHPAVDADAEYVELSNSSGGPVTLFDFVAMEPWRLTDDSGIDFRFPTDLPVTLGTDERILLVRDVAALRQYAVPPDATVLDWGSGKLDNQGETLRLLKPGDVDQWGIRHWIEVDRVRFSDGSHGQNLPGGIDPWPVPADGSGLSLNRLRPARYGNDPNNWHATIPTPGAVND